MVYTDPAQALGLCDLDPGAPLARVLRAAGTPEALIAGGASDYDRFAALAAALPLCPGHPVAAQVGALLAAACGSSLPLCPHTAPLLWRLLAEGAGWELEDGVETIWPPARVCPDCSPVGPEYLPESWVSWLPSPEAVAPGETFGDWTRRWPVRISDTTDQTVGVTLSPSWCFTRPNPYHVSRAVQALSSGEEVEPAMTHMVTAQALRLAGEQICRRGGTLLLLGGRGDEVGQLLDYLEGVDRLPPAIWIPREPVQAAIISGQYATVRTGMDLRGMTADQRQAALDEYARVAPLGRCVALVDESGEKHTVCH